MSALHPLRANNGHTARTKSMSHVDFDAASTGVAAKTMRNELNKLVATVEDPTEKKLFETEMDNFFQLFNRYLADKAKGAKIKWEKIQPPAPQQVIKYNEIPKAQGHQFLNKLAVLKLNGGLGTTMGCVGPKSAIEVRDGMTFLDLSVRQIEHLNKTYDVNVPFILMNSFNTDHDTQRIIQKYASHNLRIMTFNQSRFPRVLKDSLVPMADKADSDIREWYPPGHGDLFEALQNSGVLDQLIAEGKEYIFISNTDNLGAVVDETILQHMVESQAEFLMEVTDKTKADVKGGTIIDYEGQVRLLEIAQVPKLHVEDFKSIKKFKIFNTNNLWVSLPAIKRVLDSNELELEVIVNNKTLDSGEAVIQLETAVGAAIKHFKNAHGVNVPRSRFLPVKSCSDLLIITSDLYSVQHGQLVMNSARMFASNPLVKLGDHFKKVDKFLSRFKSMPHMIELDHLTVQGDVKFGRGVTLIGTVIIVANHGDSIEIPDGSIIENKLITGSLHIFDH